VINLVGFEDDGDRVTFAGALMVAAPVVVAAELERMADQIDRGPAVPLHPWVISALVRERAADVRALAAGRLKEPA